MAATPANPTALSVPHPKLTATTELSTVNAFSWHLHTTAALQTSSVAQPSRRFATVPGSYLSDLNLPSPLLGTHANDPIYTVHENASVTYETTFALHAAFPSPPLLILSSLQSPAHVTINSHALLSATNSFHPHAAPLPPSVLQPCNTLRIHFPPVRVALAHRAESHTYREWNDPVGGVSRLRLPQYLAGWDWGPRQLCPAIARTVHLFHAPVAAVADVACVQTVSPGLQPTATLFVAVDLAVRDPCAGLLVRCELRLQGTPVAPVPQSQAVSLRMLDHLSVDDDLRVKFQGSRLWNVFSEAGDSAMSACRFGGIIEVESPKLWWPNGMGEQPLYTLEVSVLASEKGQGPVVLDSRSQNIGLRKLELIREPTPGLMMNRDVDDSGNDLESDDSENDKESFLFAVNDRRFFAKGANFIPVRVDYVNATDEEYEQTVLSARQANMNMLRVWGGGLYENDAFYDACDRLGILLWHDFMFSCSLYPGDDEFIESCKKEARYQVSRLRNHTCMALWCGNNELEQVPHDILRTAETKKAYDSLFYRTLPEVLEEDPGQIPYWPSSPHNPSGYEKGFNNPNAGDTHFWDVWHARKPVAAYLKHTSRFCSEFGMQSYLSEAGARAFAGYKRGALNPFGPIMEAHQKNVSGNLIIQEYCQRLFRSPRDYAAMAYQSQLNQLICVRTGVEHFRRSWPYCAGAIYWQLNDCWPCFSWSSLEFGGNWKALHYGAKDFFAPLLVSAVHHGEESVGICNLTSFSKETGKFSLFATFDGPDESLPVELKWTVVDVRTSTDCGSGKEKIILRQDTSTKLRSVDLRGFESFDPRNFILRVDLESCCGRFHSSATGWCCSPRLYELPVPEVQHRIERFEIGRGQVHARIEVVSSCFAPYVEISLDSCGGEFIVEGEQPAVYTAPTRFSVSKNYFDLFRKEAVFVDFVVREELSYNTLKSRIRCRTLVDSYMD